ncbi:MAG: TolC family protein [Pseudomonadota bacterium]
MISLLADRGVTVPATEDAAAFTNRTLAAPITAQSAAQLALLNNPGLRQEFARLGFSAAELYDAGRLANPVLSMARLSPGDPVATHSQLSVGIAVNFTDLLMWSSRKRYSSAQFEATRLSVGNAALQLVTDVEKAWYDLVVAEQKARLWQTIAASASVSAALAQRFFEAGNISRRELAMEKAAAGSAQAEAQQMRAEADAARSRLNQLMGLRADQGPWQADLQLPLPREETPELKALLEQAARQRLDIASAEKRAQAIARRYRLERRTRLVGDVELGFEREREFDGTVNKGPSLGLELPLFNWGGGRVRAARAELAQAEAELDETTLAASNEVQRALSALQNARARIDLYRGTVIPQREEVVARIQEELGYMLVGVFEAVTARQDEYRAWSDYLSGLGDYWRAHADLVQATGGAFPGSASSTEAAFDPSIFVLPDTSAKPEDTNDHSMHRSATPEEESGSAEQHDMHQHHH